MKVRATWEIDIDTDDIDPEFVEIKLFAIDLAKRELQQSLDNEAIEADDFTFELEKENNNGNT